MSFRSLPARGRRLSATVGLSLLLLLASTGTAEAIPPPEIVRIGSVFIQSLAVVLVFLSPVLFFLRKQVGRLLTAMRSGRRLLTVLLSIVLLVLTAWGMSAVWVRHLNRNLAVETGKSREAVVTDGGAMAFAGVQFDITDPSFSIAPQAAAQLAKAGSHVLIDIREPAEFTTRHVPGSIHIRLGDLMAGGEYRQLDPDKKIILLCEASERGSAVAAFLRLKGFQAWYVENGIRGWIEQKLPYNGRATMQLPDFTNKYKKLPPDEGKDLLQTGKRVLVDVRTRTEFNGNHLPGAINLPLVNLPSSDVAKALEMLPANKEIVGVAYDRFGAYYCLIVGYLLDQQNKRYGGTLMMTTEQR